MLDDEELKDQTMENLLDLKAPAREFSTLGELFASLKQDLNSETESWTPETKSSMPNEIFDDVMPDLNLPAPEYSTPDEIFDHVMLDLNLPALESTTSDIPVGDNLNLPEASVDVGGSECKSSSVPTENDSTATVTATLCYFQEGTSMGQAVSFMNPDNTSLKFGSYMLLSLQASASLPSSGSCYVWEGNLFAPDLETPIDITMKGYGNVSQLEILVANWPTTLRIAGFIPQNILTLRYTGKSNWLVFRARESDEVLTHMQKNNLCATIHIRPMALLLSVRDEACDLIGILVHEDILSLWSEPPRLLLLAQPPLPPLQQWRWQQLQQQLRWQQLQQHLRQLQQEVQQLQQEVQKGRYRWGKGKLKSPERKQYELQLLALPPDQQQSSSDQQESLSDQLRRLSKEVLEDVLADDLQMEMELLMVERMKQLRGLHQRLASYQQQLLHTLPYYIGCHCVEG